MKAAATVGTVRVAVVAKGETGQSYCRALQESRGLEFAGLFPAVAELAVFCAGAPDTVILLAPRPEEVADDLRDLAKYCPRAKTIVVSWTVTAIPAFAAGPFCGWLAPDVEPPELEWAIRLIAAGFTVCGPAQGEAVLGADDAAALTPRELEVLRVMAMGLSNKGIASELAVSEKTVKNHVSSILGKLSADDRTHAVVKAFRSGLVVL